MVETGTAMHTPGECRDLSVEIVDGIHGYTCEHSSHPAQHRADYDYVEGKIGAHFADEIARLRASNAALLAALKTAREFIAGEVAKIEFPNACRTITAAETALEAVDAALSKAEGREHG